MDAQAKPAPDPIPARAADLLAQAGQSTADADRGRLFMEALAVLQQADHLDPAIAAAQSAVAAFARCTDAQGMANALSHLGVLQRRRGDLAASCETLQQAHDAARTSGNEALLARAAINYATSMRMAGQLDRAMDLTNEATRLYRARGDLAGVARSLQQRAMIDELEGAFDDALKACHEAAELHEITRNQPAQARAIANSGILQWLMGDLAMAQQTILRAQEMFKELGLVHDLLLSYGNLSSICSDRGDPAGVVRWLQAMLAAAQAAGDRRQIAFALIGLAANQARLGNDADARLRLDEIEANVGAAVLYDFWGWVLGLRASLAGSAGDLAQAVALAGQSLEAAKARADVHDTAAAERALGHWYHCAGNQEAAMRHTLNALELLDRARTTRSVRFLHAIAQMAVLENECNGRAGARPLAQQAVALARELRLGESYPEAQLRLALQKAMELSR